jgi:phage FluMu protein Com
VLLGVTLVPAAREHFLGTRATFDCSKCGATNSVDDDAEKYVCASCGKEWRFLRCDGCKTPSIVAKGDDLRWKCPRCPRVNGYLAKWSTAAAAEAEGGLVAVRQLEPTRVAGSVIAAEGFLPLAPGVPCQLEFGADTISVGALPRGLDDAFYNYRPVATVTYQGAGYLRVGGRGALTSTTGGGWFGGGFGLAGIAEGVLLATALNALTSRTTTGMETIVHFNAGGRELMLLNEREAPGILQVRLAPVFARLNDAKAEQGGVGAPRVDPVQRIEQLAALRDKGLLTAEEFQTSKQALLKLITG